MTTEAVTPISYTQLYASLASRQSPGPIPISQHQRAGVTVSVIPQSGIHPKIIPLVAIVYRSFFLK